MLDGWWHHGGRGSRTIVFAGGRDNHAALHGRMDGGATLGIRSRYHASQRAHYGW